MGCLCSCIKDEPCEGDRLIGVPGRVNRRVLTLEVSNVQIAGLTFSYVYVKDWVTGSASIDEEAFGLIP